MPYLFLKVAEDALPRILSGSGIVTGPLIIEKRMLRMGVDLDVVWHMIFVKRDIKPSPLLRCEILFGIRADDRAGARHCRKRARVARVKRSDHFEPVIGTGPGDGKTAAHTEADSADAIAINARLLREIGQGGLEMM